jgi:hypothetical protein
LTPARAAASGAAIVLLQQGQQQVLRLDELLVVAEPGSGRHQGLLEFGGEFVEAHGESPGKISDTRQMRTPLNISTG